MSKPKEITLTPKITPEELMSECSRYLTLHILQFLTEEREARGEEFAERLAFNFMASYIASLGAGFLNADYNARNEREREKLVMDGFLEFKQNTQDAIAAGFSGCMTIYSGQPVDYYCQVKLVPEVSGKLDS